jgi:hypothetical protein
VEGLPQRAGRPHAWRGLLGTAQYVSRWMVRDPGWRVLSLLGALNVGVNAYLVADGTVDPVRVASSALQEHARLFLILLATIYAGELVWREREERSSPLFQALPVRDGALIAGRIIGVLVAQGALALLLAIAAVMAVALAGAGVALAVIPSLAWAVLLPFWTWMLLALVVHVLVQQKVVAHLLCIAAWAVVSVAVGATAAAVEGRVPAWAWVAMCLSAWSVVRVMWTRDAAGRRLPVRTTAADGSRRRH